MKTIIPVAGIPNEIFQINLRNVLYTFHVLYNTRYDFWSLSLLQNNTVLFRNVKLVQGYNIGGLYNLQIGGILYIESVSGDASDPTRDDLGKDKLLIYDDLQ